jgi:phage replication initiation protein
MFDSNSRDQEPGRAVGDGALLAGDVADARPLPRIVTTGRKKAAAQASVHDAEYFNTGERVELTSSGGRGISVTRQLDAIESAPAEAALIDALAFSVLPPEEKSYPWVIEQMQQFLTIEIIEYRRGLFGFRYSARIGEGVAVMAWGGDSQRGRVFFSLMGQGCSMVKDWPGDVVQSKWTPR